MRSEIIRNYFRHGLVLTAFNRGTKGPSTANWNTRSEGITYYNESLLTKNLGIMHVFSGTMGLDIDDYFKAKTYFKSEVGLDLDELIRSSSFTYTSTRKGRLKCIFRTPKIIPTVRIKEAALELRCGPSELRSDQDVLPPSMTFDPNDGSERNYAFIGDPLFNTINPIPRKLLSFWESIRTPPAPLIQSDFSDVNFEKIENFLKSIPPDCSREEWIKVGMAIHQYSMEINQPQQGFHLWNEWSKGGKSKYKGVTDLTTQWRSFKVDKHVPVTLSTLMYIARHHGYKDDYSEYFKKAEQKIVPTTVMIAEKPLPPVFKMEHFPSKLLNRAMYISNSVGCDPIVPIWAGLAAVCAAVDSRIRYEVLPNFKVPPILWLMTVGDPADKKTPGSKPMFKFLQTIEKRDIPNFKVALQMWEGQEMAYNAAKKEFLNYAASSDWIFAPEDAVEVPELPTQPAPLRLIVQDVTSQALVRECAARPYGLLCYLDEMNSWIRKLTSMNSSEDRSSWVVAYEGERYEMDRVSGGRISCEQLSVSIYGNVQPAVLRSNMDRLTDDGLMQRFLPGILRSDLTRQGDPFRAGETFEKEWDDLLDFVHSLPITTYTSSPDAVREFREFQRWYESTKREERLLQSTTPFMTAFGKLEGLVARLTLVFHIITNGKSPVIAGETVRNVVNFVKTYVIPAYRLIFEEDLFHDVVNVIKRELLTSDVNTISEHRIRIKIKNVGSLPKSELEQMIHTAMTVFEQMRWVSPSQKRKGAWLINPALATQFADLRAEILELRKTRLGVINQEVLNG